MIFALSQAQGKPDSKTSPIDFALRNGLSVDVFFTRKNFEQIKRQCFAAGDVLVVDDITCLGSSLAEIRDNLAFLSGNGITIFSAAENYHFLPNEETALLLKGMDLTLDIRRSLLSVLTSRALAEKKASGAKLGRSLHAVMKKHLDGKESYIREKLASGMSKSALARQLNVSRTTLYDFLRKGCIYEKTK